MNRADITTSKVRSQFSLLPVHGFCKNTAHFQSIFLFCSNLEQKHLYSVLMKFIIYFLFLLLSSDIWLVLLFLDFPENLDRLLNASFYWHIITKSTYIMALFMYNRCIWGKIRVCSMHMTCIKGISGLELMSTQLKQSKLRSNYCSFCCCTTVSLITNRLIYMPFHTFNLFIHFQGHWKWPLCLCSVYI